MYSLSIHFGPHAVVWAFLFKDEKRAQSARITATSNPEHATHFSIVDDFGQWASFAFTSVHGIVLEDLDLTDEAKILRSLANARNEVRARLRAATDPVIRTGAQQGGPSVLTPFRQN